MGLREAIDAWLAELRALFLAEPELLALFDIYAAEASFGSRFIASDLQQIGADAEVLEVGAGAMILSCQLVRAGYKVTALEPIGSGFGHFERMRAIVLAHARKQGCEPRVMQIPAEELQAIDQFDYAFSINVMEHVLDIEATLRRVVASLRPGGAYRFTCPNYLFPYEPHFNIPTLISKRVTERVMHARIHGRQSIPDAAGLWRSLNWIHVAGVRRIARRIPDVRVKFGRRLLVTMLERVVTDSDFASRRSPFARAVIRTLVRFRLHRSLGWVPAIAQPVMDCSVLRLSPAGGR